MLKLIHPQGDIKLRGQPSFLLVDGGTGGRKSGSSMRFSPAVVTFVGRKSDGKVVPVYDIRMPDMLHSGERLLLWPWSGVECSKSEQRNNAEYILANKKLVPTPPQPPKSASFFPFFRFFVFCWLFNSTGWKLWKIVLRQFASSLCLHLPPICNGEEQLKKRDIEHFCGRFAVDFIMPTFNCRKSMPRWPSGKIAERWKTGLFRGHV